MKLPMLLLLLLAAPAIAAQCIVSPEPARPDQAITIGRELERGRLAIMPVRCFSSRGLEGVQVWVRTINPDVINFRVSLTYSTPDGTVYTETCVVDRSTSRFTHSEIFWTGPDFRILAITVKARVESDAEEF